MSPAAALGRFPGQIDNESVAPNGPRAKAANSARVGLVLLDSSLKPMYCNSEAISIFAYPSEPGKVKLTSAEFSEQIRSIVRQMPAADEFPITTYFLSGR